MRTSKLQLAALGASVVGLAASVASAIDDLGGAPAFCAETGCEIVRASAWARPLGIPMSVLGIAFFALALALAVVHRPRLRLALAVAGGAWAIGLVVVQAFVIGAWCKLCLVADPAAILYAALVVASRQRPTPLTFTWARAAATVPALAAVTGVLALWTSTPAPSAPVAAPAEITTASRDAAVTVVEYIDFECPFCRVMQGRLDDAIAQSGRAVRVVRKMVPIPQHRGALVAALAWCVADALGKGDAMARALFAAAPSTLTAAGCEALASELGIDRGAYRAGLAAAEQRVRADLAEAEQIGVAALPTLFVGPTRFVGASASTADLAAALGASHPAS